MQTRISSQYQDTPEGREADRILRACVHCGFCTATCPTYQLLGDELDGPRGRIYLVKQLLEGNRVSRSTQLHLDRCLTCRSCETTCPSGVQYGRLADIGRLLLEREVARPWLEKIKRRLLRSIVPHPTRFATALQLARSVKALMPQTLAQKIPAMQNAGARPTTPHPRKMLVLEGCAQSVATPRTNAAAARVLDKLGIELIRAKGSGCCGAVSHHLSAQEEGLDFMRRNIDAWWPHIETGAEAILISASGCGATVKEYAYLLKDDAQYAQKAERVAALAKDISEVLRDEPLEQLKLKPATTKVAFHSPCTLQHAQKLNGVVESILRQAGFQLTHVSDAHLCCGSAGTYSLLQPRLSQQLLANKTTELEKDQPEIIATANVGCQLQLQSATRRPVKHWIELLDDALN